MNSRVLTGPAEAAVFDLIEPFAECGDAKLRGNAVLAYAALASGDDVRFHEPARNGLVEVLLTAPPGGDAEWLQRFGARALEAMRNLPQEPREGVRGELLRRCEDAGAMPSQRRGAARLLLEFDEQLMSSRPLGWLQYTRLTWSAGRERVLRSLFAATWRAFMLYVAVAVPIGMTDSKVPEWLAAALLMWTLSACIQAVVWIGGRIRPGTVVRWADTGIAAATFALIGAASTAWVGEDDQAVHVVLGGAIGTLAGAALRAWHWRPLRLNPEPTIPERLIDALGCVAALTLGLWVASYLGLPQQVLAACFTVLTVATLLSAWLDRWADSTGPQPLAPRSQRQREGWSRLGPAASLVAVSLLVVVFDGGRLADGPLPTLVERIARETRDLATAAVPAVVKGSAAAASQP